jgi:CDP-diacylglycerol--glycerol-3-phosphate 3-phosphatidyltransferase
VSVVGGESAGLRRHWGVAVGVFLAAFVGAGVAVSRTLDPTAAVRWAAVAAPVAAFELWFLSTHLDRNHPEGEPAVYASLGAANAVTLARGWLLVVLAGFALVEPTPSVLWVPALCYGAATVLDRTDGAVARTCGHTSVLGRKLDFAFDTLGFLVAPAVGALWGRLPVWYLSLSAARYLFKAGCALRRRRGLPVGHLPDSRVRRPLAGLQMLFITVALVPTVPADAIFAVAPAVLAPSLAVFVRDYLAVTSVGS